MKNYMNNRKYVHENVLSKLKITYVMQQQKQFVSFFRTLPLKYQINRPYNKNRVIAKLFFFITLCVEWVKYNTTLNYGINFTQ